MPRDDAKAGVRPRAAPPRAGADRRRGCARSPTTSRYMLPFEEVVAALGPHERARPRHPADRARVDRRHRRPRAAASSTATSAPPPTCAARWERIAAARRRGEAMPPIDVYRIGDLHFVKDGHHRVSVARALRRRRHRGARARGADQARRRAASCGCATSRSSSTSACSTSASRCARAARADPALRRVALRAARRCSSRPGATARATSAASCSHAREMAQRWFTEEYEPVVAGAARGRAPAARAPRPSATCALAMLRYLLLHTHEWTDEILERLLGEARAPERRGRTRWSTRSSRRCAKGLRMVRGILLSIFGVASPSS